MLDSYEVGYDERDAAVEKDEEGYREEANGEQVRARLYCRRGGGEREVFRYVEHDGLC